MTGECETCAKRETCNKEIGIIFGFCKTDYEPENEKIVRRNPSEDEI